MKKKIIMFGIIIAGLIISYDIIKLYNLINPGYVYENGTWNYVSYDAAVGRRVSPIEVKQEEFQLLDYKNFARDNSSVYYKVSKLEGSDPDTFQLISGTGRYRYAKDKNNVYVYVSNDWEIFRVINADPDSFEILEFPYSKDKNDAYCVALPLYVDDVSEFEVIESSGFSMMSSVDSFLGSESDVGIHLSEYERSKREYNRKKYGFITEWVAYSEHGKARTDKLVYEGYRLVEPEQ